MIFCCNLNTTIRIPAQKSTDCISTRYGNADKTLRGGETAA